MRGCAFLKRANRILLDWNTPWPSGLKHIVSLIKEDADSNTVRGHLFFIKFTEI